MRTKKSSRLGRLSRLALAGLALGSLAACKTTEEATATSQVLVDNDYRLRHPIVLAETMETLDLPVGYSTRTLGGALQGSVEGFAKEARAKGNGRVEILVPSGAANEMAVHALTPQIRRALAQGGVGQGAQMLSTYAVEDANADAPIRLAYARVKAVAGPCGNWPENIGGGVNVNKDYHNFGCATQANLAAMVENPADLLAPRAETPADQQRRAIIYKGYRAGTGTSSQYTEGVGAQVSE
ncbi:CpaD family pilus assembly protein [Roseibium aestuarii]|uniref:CpaD family pilus assembly protein n=1 Tax=Roseibium aestuarii TaxID=2600299 RepID=A0ABW4JXK5_9HYPH|nr:CpaD family pilus assembly protein [Roseibium aestuarii]